jgi:phage terminase large subunit GpA-like protein
MQSIHDESVRTVSMMWASQTGKTETVNNIVGYFISADPSPILVVQPTIDRAEEWSKERFVPMIRDCPDLSDKIASPRSRDSGNTILTKSFPGGSIAIAGANAPSGLAARPRRVVIMDEVDRFPESAGTEGDPCALAERRTESYWNAIILKTSTPTIKGASRIESEFTDSDQRRWHCKCPRCGTWQWLKWSQVQWPKDKPEEAVYVCEAKMCPLTDADRVSMVKAGEWRATAPFKGRRGYHLNGINSLFRHKRGYRNRLHQMAEEFLDANRKGKQTLKTWVNTFLAETYEEETDKVEGTDLMKRRESYKEAPSQVVVITAGADVQMDRVEIEFDGWGAGEESWALAYMVIPGRYDDPKLWEKVDEALSRKFKREDGVLLNTSAAIVDSGAYQDHVLKFTKPRFARNIIAGKGENQPNKPVLSAMSRGNKLKAPQYRLGTDTAKGILMSRLKHDSFGPGYMHFTDAKEAGFDANYFQMLTAEASKVVFSKGFGRREWIKTRPRNEALDCRVMSLAALYHLNPNWQKVEKGIAKRLEMVKVPLDKVSNNATDAEVKPEQESAKVPVRRVPRRGFVNNWRRY